jgi:anti-sigma factor ChrR (cupin superfamily)
MVTGGEKQARPHGELIRELLDSRIPKSEREHAAAREIERLRDALEEIRSRSSIGVMRSDQSDQSELEVVLGDICLFVDAVLWKEYLLRDQEEDNEQ